MGFEPMIGVLQTLALPLGYVAETIKADTSGRLCLVIPAYRATRAGEEARTLNLLLGKETFYQLNYTRVPCALVKSILAQEI